MFSIPTSGVPTFNAVLSGGYIHLTATITQKIFAEFTLIANSKFELFNTFEFPFLNYSAWKNKDYQCFINGSVSNQTITVDISDAPFNYAMIDIMIGVKYRFS